MTGIVGIAALFTMLIVVIWLVTGGRSVPVRLGDHGDADKVVILEGLVGALAVASLVASLPTDTLTPIALGAVLGLVTRVQSRLATRRDGDTGLPSRFFYGAVGVVAALFALTSMFSQECATPTPVPPWVVALLGASVGALCLGLSFFGSRDISPARLSAVGLGWFAAVETLARLASPLGYSMFPGDAWYLIGLVLFTVVIGAGLGRQPEIVFVILSVIFLLVTVVSAVDPTGSPCAVGDVETMVTVLASFLAAFVLTSMVGRVFYGRV